MTRETDQKRTIARNASVLLGSHMVSWAVGFLLVIFLPRYLGPELVGKYALVTAIWGIATMLAGFGSEMLLTKEIARHPERAPQLMTTTIVLRLCFYLLSAIVVASYVYLMGYGETLTILFILVGVTQSLVHLAAVATSALTGLERMGPVSLAAIVGKLLNVSLGLLVILLGLGVYAIAVVNFLTALVGTVIVFYFLIRLSRIWTPFTLREALATLKAGIPFLLTGLLLVLYQQVDTIVISNLVSYEALGWYNTARNLVGTMVFMPTIFITAVFPALSRSHSEGSSMLQKIASKSINLMLLCAVPIGLGLLTIADPLVMLLYGEQFAPSGSIVAVMGVSLIVIYQTVILGYFLIATDRLPIWMFVMAAGVVATVVLDIILVPWCERMFNNGAIGGALSYIITESAMVVVGLCLMPKGTLGWSNLWFAMRVIGAGVAMVAVTWWFRDMFIVVPIAVGAVVYIGLIAALRVVSSEDLQLLTGMLRSKFGSLPIFRKVQSASIEGS